MPMVKGAKLDPKTGKFKLPAGYRKKKAEDRARDRHPSNRDENAEKSFDRLAKQAKQNQCYRIFAVHPSGKYYLQDTTEASHEFVANQYGGGRYEVWKVDMASGEYAGDPVPFNIDPAVFLPKLRDPNTAARMPLGAAPFGGQGMFGGLQGSPFMIPGMNGVPQWPQAGAASKDEDLEDELEDLQREVTRLQAELRKAKEEREEALRQIDKERAEALRKEDVARFERQLAELTAGFKTQKDPLDQFLNFKRVESELNGPIGRQSNDPASMIQMALGMMNMIMDAAKKIPTETAGGGAVEGLLRVADKYLPLLANLSKAGPEAPKPALPPAPPAALPPAPAPAPQPQPQTMPAPGPELKAFEQLVKVMPEFMVGESEVFGQWIAEQSGEGWPEAIAIIKTEPPDGFLTVLKDSHPHLTDAEDKQRWILSAMTTAQAKLLEKAAN